MPRFISLKLLRLTLNYDSPGQKMCVGLQDGQMACSCLTAGLRGSCFSAISFPAPFNPDLALLQLSLLSAGVFPPKRRAAFNASSSCCTVCVRKWILVKRNDHCQYSSLNLHKFFYFSHILKCHKYKDLYTHRHTVHMHILLKITNIC